MLREYLNQKLIEIEEKITMEQSKVEGNSGDLSLLEEACSCGRLDALVKIKQKFLRFKEYHYHLLGKVESSKAEQLIIE